MSDASEKPPLFTLPMKPAFRDMADRETTIGSPIR